MQKKVGSFLVSIFIIFIMLLTIIFLIGAYDGSYDQGKGEEQELFASMGQTEINEETQLPKIKAFIHIQNNIVVVKQEMFLAKALKSFYGYIPSKNFAETIIKQIYTDKGIEGVNINDSNLSIDLSANQDKIYLEYEIRLNKNNAILSYNNDKILLTNFLITPAVYKDDIIIESYTWDFGDPFIYDLYSYDITLMVDKSYNVYGGGKYREDIDGDHRVVQFLLNNYRDFSLILCRNSNVVVEKYNDINITYVDSFVSKPYVQNAIDFAENNFSKYPYTDLIVVSVPMNNLGMEFSGMIFINEKSFQHSDTLKSLIYHEVFHQWFYGVLGVDQLNEPFLDEGLVTFFTAYLTNSLSPNCEFNNSLFHMRLCDYADKSTYQKLAYGDASKYINSLYLKFGHDEFFRRIKKIFEERSFTIVSYKEFEGYFTD